MFYGDKQQHIWVYVASNTTSSVFGCNLIWPFELVKSAQLLEGSSLEQVQKVDGKPQVNCRQVPKSDVREARLFSRFSVQDHPHGEHEADDQKDAPGSFVTVRLG